MIIKAAGAPKIPIQEARTGGGPEVGFPGSTPGVSGSGGAGFADKLTEAIDGVSDKQLHADDKLSKLATGEDIDLHGTMIALEEADITLRTMVAVRDKVVNAYQEIMNMSI
ncbi:MAG: flagellar hook-basal body complex protein FliE [Myxococcota bacterium]